MMINFFKKLSDSTTTPNTPPGVATLHTAIVKDDLACVFSLLKRQPDLAKKTDSRGRQALHIAAQYGRLTLIRHLIQRQGVLVDSPDNDGNTPLHWAVKSRQQDAVWSLCAENADPLSTNQRGQTAFHLAVYYSLPLTLSYWLTPLTAQAKKKLLARTDDSDKTLLHYAAAQADPRALITLLKHGAPLDKREQTWGNTALHIAVVGSGGLPHIPHIHGLLVHGADITKTNRGGKTPAQLAQGWASPPEGYKEENADEAALKRLSSYSALANALEKAQKKPKQGLYLPEASTPIEWSRHTRYRYLFKQLVFEGGGAKGIAYHGAMQVLEAEGLLSNIEDVAGASVGAITATLLALGYDLRCLTPFITNPKNFLDIEWGALSKASLKFISRMGVSDAKPLQEWIQALGEWATGHPNVTFRQLHKLTIAQRKQPTTHYQHYKFRDLAIIGANLSTGFHEVFNWKNTPDMPIKDAVRISMSFPGAFAAVHATKDPATGQFLLDSHGHLDTRRHSGSQIYVDGGLLANYPIWLYDRGGQPSPYTLGFRVDSPEEINVLRDQHVPTSAGSAWGFFGVLSKLAQTALNNQTDLHRHRQEQFRTVYINTNMATLPLRCSEDAINQCVKAGHDATERHLAACRDGSLYNRGGDHLRHLCLERKNLYRKANHIALDPDRGRIQLQFDIDHSRRARQGAALLQRDFHISDIVVLQDTVSKHRDYHHLLCFTAGKIIVQELTRWCQKRGITPPACADETTLVCHDKHVHDPLGEQLLTAITIGQPKRAAAAIAAGAPLHYCDKNGDTALHLAAGSGIEATVALLLNKGIDTATVSQTNHQGSSALHFAAEAAALGCLIRLYDYVSPDALNRANRFGATPLHRAIYPFPNPHEADANRLKTVQWLIDHGADLAARDEKGQTPLDLANATLQQFQQINPNAEAVRYMKKIVRALIKAAHAKQQPASTEQALRTFLGLADTGEPWVELPIGTGFFQTQQVDIAQVGIGLALRLSPAQQTEQSTDLAALAATLQHRIGLIPQQFTIIDKTLYLVPAEGRALNTLSERVCRELALHLTQHESSPVPSTKSGTIASWQAATPLPQAGLASVFAADMLSCYDFELTQPEEQQGRVIILGFREEPDSEAQNTLEELAMRLTSLLSSSPHRVTIAVREDNTLSLTTTNGRQAEALKACLLAIDTIYAAEVNAESSATQRSTFAI